MFRDNNQANIETSAQIINKEINLLKMKHDCTHVDHNQLGWPFTTLNCFQLHYAGFKISVYVILNDNVAQLWSICMGTLLFPSLLTGQYIYYICSCIC